jgi:hypothetical protein
VETRGISDLVNDLIELYTLFGVHPAARPPQLGRSGSAPVKVRRPSRIGMWLNTILVKIGLKQG